MYIYIYVCIRTLWEKNNKHFGTRDLWLQKTQVSICSVHVLGMIEKGGRTKLNNKSLNKQNTSSPTLNPYTLITPSP